MSKIFIIEDDPKRIKWFRSHFKTEADIFEDVESAKKGFKGGYDQIFFDHDLGGLTYVDSNDPNTGYQFAKWLMENKLDDIKRYKTHCVVHSLNYAGSMKIHDLLRDHDVQVIRIPFTSLVTY